MRAARGPPLVPLAPPLPPPAPAPAPPLLLLLLLLLLQLPAASRGYQLANNLIANNAPPRFLASAGGPANSEIVVRVKEGPGSIGRLVHTLRGEDPDDDPLTFGVLGATASELLRVENAPGNQAQVFLRRELDRESAESYQVVITLTDGKLGRGNWITKSMLIIVEDVNDNAPLFAPHRSSISVREDARPPLLLDTLEASDADEGRFGQLIYTLHEAGPQAGAQPLPFAVETVDGKALLSLVAPLDYEQRPMFELRLTATDRAVEQERLSASTSLLISVVDCDDQPPMFTFVPAITRVPENLQLGAQVLQLSALDGDRGVNNKIHFRLAAINGLPPDRHCPFAMDPSSGALSVARPLDREAPAGSSHSASSHLGSYVLQVEASELGGGARAPATVSTELTVILTDVNDEAPTFSQQHYYAELLENSAPDTLVSLVAGPHQSALSEASQQATTAAGPPQPLVAKVVDRDQGTNGTFTLHLEGPQAHLFDVWPQEATNEASLMIKVSQRSAGALDFERVKSFELTLVAREKFAPPGSGANQPPGSRAGLTIMLRDANDNYPHFETDIYRVEIPENAARGLHVCSVQATDPDSAHYGTQGIRYTELRGEQASKFKLDPLTGSISLRTSEHGFDRELASQHHLIVEARDANGTGNRNTSQLLILLADVNDQRPKFMLDQYEASIYENEPDFQHPLQVHAVDGDSANSSNSQLTYSIVAGDPQSNFTIDPQTGRIRVRAPSPPASLSSINGLLLEAPSSFDLELLDVNHRRGAGSGGGGGGGAGGGGGGALELGLSEPILAEQPGSPAAALAAAQAQAQPVGLDFERMTAQARDETRFFNLTVRATDSGAPEPLWADTSVIVTVHDKNDHAPVFTRPLYAKSVREDTKEASPVLQVLAHDGDHSPSNSRVSYRIASGAADKFAIDPDTGLITVALGASLDIERAGGGGQHTSGRRTNYLLTVVAFDGSFGPGQKSASALVNISIVDVNNKPPEFVSLGGSSSLPTASGLGRSAAAAARSANQTPAPAGVGGLNQQVVQVNEDAPYGLIVTRVLASDPDSNAELRYSINQARSEARNDDMQLVEPALVRDTFAIDPIDGTIRVAKPLDRELFDQVKLRLQVEDIAAAGAEQLAHAYLLIKVTDVNDNRPAFKRALYKAIVNENSVSGTSVITLTAEDRDLNKTLRYSLEGPAEQLRLVRINPRSGEVTVNDRIDREQHPLINLTVRADDSNGGPHALSGSAQLLISVRDENDNNPIFQNQSVNYYTGSGHNSASFSTELGPDGEPTEGSSVGEAGALSTPGSSTMASGGLRPRTVDLATLQQRLPLLAPGGVARVREDAPVGTQVAYVRAEDADLGSNGRVTYLLSSASAQLGGGSGSGSGSGSGGGGGGGGSGSGGQAGGQQPGQLAGGASKFRVDRDTGLISVAGELDREARREYALLIEACDNYELGHSTGDSRRAFAQVTIQLLDVNDNAPQIELAHAHKLAGGPSEATGPLSSLGRSATASSSNGWLPTSGAGSRRRLPDGGLYDERLLDSQGPFELPLDDCLAISEFQPLDEPIVTLSARDADDPATPNGQLDLVIVNSNGAGSESALFGLLQVSEQVSPPQQPPLPPPPPPPPTTTTTTAMTMTTTTTTTIQPGELARSSADQLGARSRRWANSALQNSHYHGLQSPASHARARQAALALSRPHQPHIMATDWTPPAAVPSAPSPAHLDANSNQVQLVQLVLRQSLKERVGNYSVLVRATDRGEPSLSTLKVINICVQDVNNHAPIFSRPPLNHTIRVLENATLGTHVIQLEATDADHGPNGAVEYSLKPTNAQNSNNDWQAFKIDPLTGVISSARLFNRQLKRYYTLRVQAQDLGRPTRLASDIDINIMIVNSGQYQPEFDGQLQQLQFTENLAPGLEWFLLLSTTNLEDDPALIDMNSALLGPHSGGLRKPHEPIWNMAKPCYFVVDGDDHEQLFELDRYTHKLVARRPLDRERKANYTLLVQATNSCHRPPLSPSLQLEQASRLEPPASSNQQQQQQQQHPNGLVIDYRSSARSPEAAGELLLASSRSKKSVASQPSSLGPRPSRPAPTEVEVSPASLASTSGFLPASSLSASQTAAAELQVSGPSSFSEPAIDALLATDKSLLKVVINVRDVNDNAPRFTQRVYTGGITTEADFGTVFMIVQAFDADANNQIVYSLIKPIKRNFLGSSSSLPPSSHLPSSPLSALSPQPEPSVSRRKRAPPPPTTAPPPTQQPSTTSYSQLQDTTTPNLVTTKLRQSQQHELAVARPALNELATDLGPNELDDTQGVDEDLFVINAQTGEISLNFDPQKHMKGYFEFQVLANDTEGLFDSAKVFIYLLRQDQRVKFVLRLTPQELRQRLNKFRSVFGNITGAIVNIDSYKYYENHDGTVDKKKTSLYLHFVNPEDNTIIEVDKVLTMIDNNIEYLDELYKEFHVLSSEAAHQLLSSSALIDPIDQIRTGLVGVSSFLALILVLVIALCVNQRTRYERQLKAATVGAFGGSPLHLDPDYHSHTNLPNTNLHSQDPNPMWINGYAHDQEWLAGGPTKPPSGSNKQLQAGSVSKRGHQGVSSAGHNQDGDDDRHDLYISSGDNSLSALNNDTHGLHFNGATTATATPRDSLSGESHGHPSGSGSGSSSTTNDQHALCGAGSRNTASTRQAISSGHQQHVAKAEIHSNNNNIVNNNNNNNNNKQQQSLASVLKVGGPNHDQASSKKRGQLSGQGAGHAAGSTHSTFGAFKEVTIYTEHANQQQQRRLGASDTNSLVRTVAAAASNAAGLRQQQQQQQLQQQQQQHHAVVSQVTKIASQINARQQAHSKPAAPMVQPSVNQVYIGQQPIGLTPTGHQRISIHSNGADINHGIIKTSGSSAVSAHQPAGLGHLACDIKSSAKFQSAKPSLVSGLKSHKSHTQANSTSTTSNSNRNNINSSCDIQQRRRPVGGPAAGALLAAAASAAGAGRLCDAAENFETNLSKLKILNLETTEL